MTEEFLSMSREDQNDHLMDLAAIFNTSCVIIAIIGFFMDRYGLWFTVTFIYGNKLDANRALQAENHVIELQAVSRGDT
jgi:hypothetical protein